jgi:two-component system, LytTR family, response regulator
MHTITRSLWRGRFEHHGLSIRTLFVHAALPPLPASVRRAFEACPDVHVIGESSGAVAALHHIRELRPDLVVLDASLPDGGARRVLDAVASEEAVQVVIVATSAAYAARAFEANAIDFVVVPADEVRVERCIDRVRHFFKPKRRPLRRRSWSMARGADGYLQRMTAMADGRYHMLSMADVDWFASDANYVQAHAGGRQYRVRETMKGLEAKLDPGKFLRVHRSIIVQLDRIVSVEPLPGGEHEITLKNGAVLKASRSYAGAIHEWLRNSAAR